MEILVLLLILVLFVVALRWYLKTETVAVDNSYEAEIKELDEIEKEYLEAETVNWTTVDQIKEKQ